MVEFVHAFTKNAVRESGSSQGFSDDPAEADYGTAVQKCEQLLSRKCMERTALKQFDVQEPHTITLEGLDEENKYTYQYLPLAPQLREFFRNKNVNDVLKTHNNSETEELHGLQDGYAYKDVKKDEILLNVYYDGFQSGNPLGSASKKHAIGAVYCSIGNTNYSGSLDDIFVVLVFQEIILQTHRWSALLSPLIDELKELEADGIDLFGKRCEVRVAVLTGDNLGVHSVAGFSKCFSGGGFLCRHCNVTKDDIGHQTKADQAQSRTRKQYDATLQLLVDENFDETACEAVGVYAPCPLTVLKNFHPVDSLPPDVMHDVLEGVAPSTINLVVNELVREEVVDAKAVRQYASKEIG